MKLQNNFGGVNLHLVHVTGKTKILCERTALTYYREHTTLVLVYSTFTPPPPHQSFKFTIIPNMRISLDFTAYNAFF